MYTDRTPMKRFPSLIAILIAGSFSLAQQKPPVAPKSAPVKPPADSQLYRNTTFSFRYRIPVGWVDRTRDMQGGDDLSKAQVLLAIFERPPEAAGDTINSTVVIAAESAASYPGLKKAEDYLGPLTELTTSKGFKSAGDPSVVTIDGRDLVRADFTKPRSETLVMHQSTLALLQKGRIVSFTFIAGADDEIDNLIEGLGFVASSRKR